MVETQKKLMDAINNLIVVKPTQKFRGINAENYLSNIKGPLVLCVWEKMHFEGEVHSGTVFQSWCFDYIPSNDTQEWILK